MVHFPHDSKQPYVEFPRLRCNSICCRAGCADAELITLKQLWVSPPVQDNNKKYLSDKQMIIIVATALNKSTDTNSSSAAVLACWRRCNSWDVHVNCKLENSATVHVICTMSYVLCTKYYVLCEQLHLHISASLFDALMWRFKAHLQYARKRSCACGCSRMTLTNSPNGHLRCKWNTAKYARSVSPLSIAFTSARSSCQQMHNHSVCLHTNADYHANGTWKLYMYRDLTHTHYVC